MRYAHNTNQSEPEHTGETPKCSATVYNGKETSAQLSDEIIEIVSVKRDPQMRGFISARAFRRVKPVTQWETRCLFDRLMFLSSSKINTLKLSPAVD